MKLSRLPVLAVIVAIALFGCSNPSSGPKEPETFSVYFDSTGGSSVGTLSDIVSGSLISEPEEPMKTDYAFSGWYLDPGTWMEEWDFTDNTVVCDVTLYAKWTYAGETYTVTFEKNDGSPAETVSGFELHDLIDPSMAPSREGYALVGWYEDAELTDEWDFNVDTVTSDMTLYADWTYVGGTFTVTFDSREGSAVESLTGILPGSTISEPPAPTRSGYVFTGWYEDAELTDEWDFDTDTIASDLTLLAGWDHETCRVDFDSNEGSFVDSLPSVQYGSLIDEPAAPTRGGYVFDGWFEDEALTDRWAFDVDTVVEDMTLHAKWTVIPTYSVTFHPNEADYGNVPSAQVKTEGIDLALAGNSGELRRANYLFNGWNTRSDGLGTDYAAGGVYSADEDLLLYAKWLEIGEDPIIRDVAFLGPASIDTSEGDRAVTFVVTAADDIALNRVVVAVRSSSGQSLSSSVSVTDPGYSPISNRTEGTFTIEVQIPRYSDFGTWTLTQVQAADSLNHYTTYYSASLPDEGWDYSFEQTGAGDMESPTISAVNFEGPSAIDTSTGDQVVTFTVTVSDDIALNRVNLSVRSSSGQSIGTSASVSDAAYSPINGNAEGTFTFDVLIPQYSDSGTWSLTQVQVADHLNNYTTYYSSSLSDAGWDYSFEQTGAGDTGSPAVSAITFEGPAGIDTSAGDQIVTFTVTAADDIALNRVSVAVRGPSGSYCSGNTQITDDEYSPINGSAEGTFTVEIRIPEYSEPGTWTIYQVQLSDHLNNYTTYDSGSLSDAGWDFSFENTGS